MGPRSSSTSRHLSPYVGRVPVLGGGGCARTLTQPRGCGLDSHPPPLRAHRPLTPGRAQDPAGARCRGRVPGRGPEGWPLSPTCAARGARGRGSWGSGGAFVFLTHLSRQLVLGGEGGAGAPRAGCFPCASPPPLPAPSPPAVGTRGVGEGARWKRQGHRPRPLGPSLPRWFQPSAQEFNPGEKGPRDPGILSYPGLPQNSWAHLRARPVQARGPHWIQPPTPTLASP